MPVSIKLHSILKNARKISYFLGWIFFSVLAHDPRSVHFAFPKLLHAQQLSKNIQVSSTTHVKNMHTCTSH
jgi:hypothetical protein